MAFDLVTGYKGEDHVTASQWADLNRGIVGDAVILDVGSKMSVAIQTANQITVNDGIVMFDGREFYIEYGDSTNIAIASGTQGMMRNDIVYIEYTKDGSTGVESGAFKVAEGIPELNNPSDPNITDMDIRTGVLLSQKKFCRVRIVGTAIVGVDILVPVMNNLPAMMANIEKKFAELNSKMDQNNSGYFSLGDNGLKIVWGTIDFESVPSGSHSAITATFPVSFKADPKVFASIEGGLAMIPIIFGKTTRDCTIWLYNLKENSAVTNRRVSYLAIGY